MLSIWEGTDRRLQECDMQEFTWWCVGCLFFSKMRVCTPTLYGYLQAVVVLVWWVFWRGALISALLPSVVLDLALIYEELGAIEMCSVQRQ